MSYESFANLAYGIEVDVDWAKQNICDIDEELLPELLKHLKLVEVGDGRLGFEMYIVCLKKTHVEAEEFGVTKLTGTRLSTLRTPLHDLKEEWRDAVKGTILANHNTSPTWQLWVATF